MIGTVNLTDILRTICSNLQTPTIFLLIATLAVTIIILGFFVGEAVTVRLYLWKKKVSASEIIEQFHNGERGLEETVKNTVLLKRQKNILLEILCHPTLTELEKESLAVRLLTREKAYFDKRTKITDLISKIAPMLGLMGTLIPLGPGIIALGQGDTFTLSNSLMVAFDTTITGLVCAGTATIISTVRKTWYHNDISLLETLMECLLEEVKEGNEKE